MSFWLKEYWLFSYIRGLPVGNLFFYAFLVSAFPLGLFYYYKILPQRRLLSEVKSSLDLLLKKEKECEYDAQLYQLAKAEQDELQEQYRRKIHHKCTEESPIEVMLHYAKQSNVYCYKSQTEKKYGTSTCYTYIVLHGIFKDLYTFFTLIGAEHNNFCVVQVLIQPGVAHECIANLVIEVHGS